MSKDRPESVSSVLGMFLQRSLGDGNVWGGAKAQKHLWVSQYVCLGQPKNSGVGELFCCTHLKNKNQVPFMARGIMSGIPSEGPFELRASLDGGAADSGKEVILCICK